MNKLNNVYNEFINNKEKNKVKINERIEMMKEKKKSKYLFGFATIATAILIAVGVYYNFNTNDKTLNNSNNSNNNDNNLKQITIEGKTYFNYYDMGVNMDQVPGSTIYGYAIRQDKESYKIVSLHQDGTNFDLVAVNEPLETVSSDESNLTTNYKLALIANKLYFIRLAHQVGGSYEKNQDYDMEVYYIDITDKHPKLELLLQTGDGPGVVYNEAEVMINNAYLYYHAYDSNIIQLLPLGNMPAKSNIVLEDKIFSYYIKEHQLYASYGTDGFDEEGIYYNNVNYAIIDTDNEDENGFNLTTLITEAEFYDNLDYRDISSSNNTTYYFETDTNRYTLLWADNKTVELKGFESSERGIGFIGNKLFVNDKEVYQYDSTDTMGITLLNTDSNIINFCLGTGSICQDDEYYSYNIATETLNKTAKTYNYFLLTYVEK